MKKITALTPYLIALLLVIGCNDDDKIRELENKINELNDEIETEAMDSLEFVLSMSKLDYQKYVDSLKRADSLALGSGLLPFSYNVVVYDGSSSSIYSEDDRVAAFDAEVEVSVSQYGETRTVTTTDGLASFDNIGRGIVKVAVTAPGYTTLKYSFETLIDPSEDLYDAYDDESPYLCNCDDSDYDCNCSDFWNFVKNGNIGHDVAIFATEGELASTLTGRAFVETDLTNSAMEVVPEGTIITAAIDVEDGDFQEEFILYRNKQIFTDNILSFGYDPNFTATVDASGDFTFTLAGSANEEGLPYHFEYSDFIADQIAFEETTGEVTSVTDQTIFGPETDYTIVPNVVQAASITFSAGGGATASLDTKGDGALIDIDLEHVGADFQGTPRVYVSAPPAGGTRAQASATVTNGRVTAITIDDAGLGYTLAPTVSVFEGSGAAAQVTALTTNNTNGGVASVSIQASGNGFSSAPNVLFSDGALDSATIANFMASLADAPTATASLNNNGTVESVSVTNAGSDIGFTPNVYITSGFGAIAEVTAVGGGGDITGITIIADGDYYTDVPVAVEAGGVTGTGAAFDITLTAGEVSGIATTSAGSGYVVGDQFNLIGVGSGATATAHYQGASVEDYTITNSGTQQVDGLYYENAPLVVFSEPEYKGPGSATAQGTAVLDSEGRVVGITITNSGSGYLAFPSITFVSGSGVLTNATIEPVVITEVDVELPGNGYLAAPRVEIYDADGVGSGATAVANISADGKVTSIQLTDAGSNYSSPMVVIVDPGYSFDATDGTVYANPAEADVVVVDGVITGITITAIGDNYPDGTNVILSALRGTGFDATTVVAGGKITGVTVNDGGEDYIGGNTPGSTQGFDGIEEDDDYQAKAGITRVRDIYYGTGKRRSGIVD